ncbi:MAG: hypothetical protein VCC04_04585 [Myxococcota bacterium]
MTEFEGLSRHVFLRLEAEGLAPAEMSLLRPIGDLVDNPIKFSIHDARGVCLGVLQWSPSGAVQAVADAVRRAEAMRRRLGIDLGGVVLAARFEGEFQSRTYALYPWQRTLSEQRVLSRLHDWLYASPVLDWLSAVYAQTFAPLPGSEYAARISLPLEQLSGEPGLAPSLREVAREVGSAVESGAFVPQVGPVHSDLWRGNILLPTERSRESQFSRRFRLIDWGASTLVGFPFGDLLRVLDSLRIPHPVARRVLRRECRALGMTLEDGRRSLILALADLGVNRNEFPLDLYLKTVAHYHAYFQKLAF